ncbi:MAG TPA: DNA alkylation repair protein [Candidatus Omnitrophota bacterium]|nr:DNA alkylation repair protein [Candidatus Omnitrophota bacterium]HPT39597.1 DNA alkylation repair protein [Candidatus Omnitrophota bacterium]
MSLLKLRRDLRKCGNKRQAKLLQRFFKTGPGEYAQGDIFLGAKVPSLRKLADQNQDLAFQETLELLKSPIHEERLLSLLILIIKYEKSLPAGKERIYKAYLKHSRYINNWDLVDITAWHIVGDFLAHRDRAVLYKLANSDALWERRIAIISTFYFIKNNDFRDTLKIAKILMADPHDLIHKAVGWMLREVGKRKINTEEEFLKRYCRIMPRTMLRYAIERFPEPKRKAYLAGRPLNSWPA